MTVAMDSIYFSNLYMKTRETVFWISCNRGYVLNIFERNGDNSVTYGASCIWCSCKVSLGTEQSLCRVQKKQFHEDCESWKPIGLEIMGMEGETLGARIFYK